MVIVKGLQNVSYMFQSSTQRSVFLAIPCPFSTHALLVKSISPFFRILDVEFLLSLLKDLIHIFTSSHRARNHSLTCLFRLFVLRHNPRITARILSRTSWSRMEAFRYYTLQTRSKEFLLSTIYHPSWFSPFPRNQRSETSCKSVQQIHTRRHLYKRSRQIISQITGASQETSHGFWSSGKNSRERKRANSNSSRPSSFFYRHLGNRWLYRGKICPFRQLSKDSSSSTTQ